MNKKKARKLQPVTMEEVTEVRVKVKLGKAVAQDEIAPEIMKYI